MIQRLLILCLACLPVLTIAQPINPWPTKNSYWQILNYDEYNQLSPFGRTWHLDGDTVLQGQTYQKVSKFYDVGLPEDYEAALRSDSLGRVFILHKDSTSEATLYDFSAQLGDTVFNVWGGLFGWPYNKTAVVVAGKDTVQMNDGPHVRLEVRDTLNSWPVQIVDAVGSMEDFLFPMYMPSVSGYDILVCMSNDSVSVIGGNCLLAGRDEGAPVKLEVFPNPTTGHIRIDFESPELVEEIELLDMHGRLLMRWANMPQQLDLSRYAEGLYLLRARSETGIATQNILKH